MRYFIILSMLLAFWGCRDDSGNTETQKNDETDSYLQARADCIERINTFRATLGLSPYSRWVEAKSCSDDEAKSDAQSGQAHGAFGDCGEFAQNECPGWDSVNQVVSDCLQDMWDEGPGEDFNAHGHYINMSSTEYSRVACGFYTTSDGKVWSVQNFR